MEGGTRLLKKVNYRLTYLAIDEILSDFVTETGSNQTGVLKSAATGKDKYQFINIQSMINIGGMVSQQ